MLDDSPSRKGLMPSCIKTAKRCRSPAFSGDGGWPERRNSLIEDDDRPTAVTTKNCIEVGDADAVWRVYKLRFENCQQIACKLLAKAWIKAMQPKKQSSHPYTGSDETAPDWWPKPWGPTKDDKVRHKEPDHLYRQGRLSHVKRHKNAQLIT